VPVLYSVPSRRTFMAEGLIVQKYGGSSLSSPRRIREVAEKIAARTRDDTRIIVAVSAMGATTDRLMRLAHQITPQPARRELDMLLTVGERVSMALLSMALNTLGCRAISFTGSQSGIVTDVSHTRALIEEIRAGRIEDALAEGHVVIVAGFQGVSRAKEITTLGRGGSDTTAVALAARLAAVRCEIYSDVPGVFTADPRLVRSARLLPRIGYDEMLELAVLGAKVLHFRAAEIARRYRVPLFLLSSFDDPRTTAVGEGDDVERETILSVASQKHVALIQVICESDDVPAELFRRLTEREVRIVSYQRTPDGTRSRLNIVIEMDDFAAVRAIAGELRSPGIAIVAEDHLASVSIVGTGLGANAARAVARLEQLLGDAGIPVRHVATSALSITCLVPVAARDRAVDILHSALIEPDSHRPASE
jgi:aspartate kinase